MLQFATRQCRRACERMTQLCVCVCMCVYTGGAMDVRVARFPVVCKSCDRDKPETMLWSGEASLNHPNHPLSWYHLINTKGGHTRRLSIVNPNFITSYSFTHGTLRQDLEPAYPEPTCMAFLHIPNMVSGCLCVCVCV